ncbi:PDDEXK family nuclease [Oceanisphaera avium]|uniref:hypothetical protein n=1 Tax=Oceanisphaera avium TaxID=1903694 RepID=UPI001E416E0B|nr:hypothetical protein [Oceanisphaera avium]
MPPVIATSLSDPLYYLRNAEQVIKLCLRQYPHLLTPEERQHLQQFLQLTTASQALLVRLVMRKGTLFRTDKLNYHEVPNLMCALEELSAVGLATLLPAITLSELCQLTKREECRHLVQRLIKTELKANTRKADLIATLLSHYPTSEPQPLATWWPEASFQVIELRAAALFERLRLMFFGNLHQDWSEFVLTELGLQQFETVPLTPDSQPFQTRAEVDLYLTLQHLLARVNEGEAIADIYPLLPAPVHCEWLEYRRNKVLYQLGRIAERQLELSLALNLYEQSSHREAYIRTLRLLEKQHPPVRYLLKLGMHSVILSNLKRALS